MEIRVHKQIGNISAMVQDRDTHDVQHIYEIIYDMLNIAITKY